MRGGRRAHQARQCELGTGPIWKVHQLTGERKGTWSLFVTRNWRITFRIGQGGIEIIDLDFEDYHEEIEI